MSDEDFMESLAAYFEAMATGENSYPLSIAQEIRRRFTFEIRPMGEAPNGDDALEPSELDVHEGSWAVVIGTNAKPIGWVDTYALFKGRTYRDRLA